MGVESQGMVLAAGEQASPGADQALAELCANYWYPLYAYVRRLGRSAEEAQDLAQEFFTRLLEKNFLQSADPSRGKFRTFLLTSFRNFLANEYDRSNAQKRGGGKSIVSMDQQTAEWKTRFEPSHVQSPERIFDRRWALTLLEQALSRLRSEYTGSGRGPIFDHLKGFLTGDQQQGTYREMASRLGLSEAALTTAIHRLRQRYREVLREEIGKTVAKEEEIDAEIRDLFTALG
jgi:RNA polymerase sigma-70 factor (ECF subfamily)